MDTMDEQMPLSQALADNERLREALKEAVRALVQHRVDMHERSHRPCETCARSKKAINQAQAVLDYTYHADGEVSS